jgi:hypothetical protein
MSKSAARAVESSPWSPREAELLEVTLRLLQQEGYERLTLDAVAATARASKATVYGDGRRKPNWCWPHSSRASARSLSHQRPEHFVAICCR